MALVQARASLVCPSHPRASHRNAMFSKAIAVVVLAMTTFTLAVPRGEPSLVRRDFNCPTEDGQKQCRAVCDATHQYYTGKCVLT
jgi:hypothetical protein